MPGGWAYLQDGTFRIEAESYEELLDNVREWRLQNGKPVGDVETEVESYICNTYPRQCRNRSTGSAPPRWAQAIIPNRATVNKFVDRITQWALGVSKHPDSKNLMEDGLANQRAERCQICPQNDTWENNCPSCVTNAQRLLALIRRGKEHASWRKLHGCKAMGHCNRTAIYLPSSLVTETPETPPECWIHTLK